MSNKTVWTSEYFCGNKVSDYGLEQGYVDYSTLAKSFNCVLNNNIIGHCIDSWELVNGNDYNEEEDTFSEIFQYYIISDNGAKILEDYTDEIVYYNEELDLYLWGVTHLGTSWDYVLTDIKIELNK